MPQNQDEKFLDLVVKRIEEEKCILIIGPDITVADDGRSINELLKEHLEKNYNDQVKYYSDDEFFSFTDESAKELAISDIQDFYAQLQPNTIHSNIAEIPFHLIISISPDRLLLKVFKEKNLDCSFAFYNKEQNPAALEKPHKQKPLIYNLYGDINTEGSLVFTYDDLFEYLISIFKEFELPQELQKELLSAKMVLLLGIKFEKWYFKLLLRILKLHQGKINNAAEKIRSLQPNVKNFYADEFKVNFLAYNELDIVSYIHGKFKDKGLLRTKSQTVPSQAAEIFISYAWGGESEKTVDNICQTLSGKGFTIIRDKINLGYKGNIQQFMKTIGKSKYVIVVISDKYLKSENCMFEMLELQKNGNVYQRIFPIVLEDAKIYDELDRIDYFNYWENRIRELTDKFKTIVNPVGTGQVTEKINQYNDIRRIFDEITDTLRNMNTLTPDMHEGNNFSLLAEALDKQIQLENEK